MTDWGAWIRDVPDFPSVGILFRDITPLWADSAAFESAITALVEPFAGDRIQKVVGIEARGFIFGSAAARALASGFVPARKPGKLPRERHRIDYALEYGSDALEIHVDAITPGERILLVDDVLATGGTARAAADLVGRCGGALAGIAFFLELTALNGRSRLSAERVESVVRV
jgi:adenine phosphoribosyltransferase